MADPRAAPPRRPCPVCGKLPPPGAERSRPFCSERCRQVDLGRWLTGGYAVPDEEPLGEDDPDG